MGQVMKGLENCHAAHNKASHEKCINVFVG